jgi:hypothetical protein
MRNVRSFRSLRSMGTRMCLNISDSSALALIWRRMRLVWALACVVAMRLDARALLQQRRYRYAEGLGESLQHPDGGIVATRL